MSIHRVSTIILYEQAIKLQGTGFSCLLFTGLLAPLHVCDINGFCHYLGCLSN